MINAGSQGMRYQGRMKEIDLITYYPVRRNANFQRPNAIPLRRIYILYTVYFECKSC